MLGDYLSGHPVVTAIITLWLLLLFGAGCWQAI